MEINCSVIGLLLDIVGVTIVFVNGIPSFNLGLPSSITKVQAYEDRKVLIKRQWSIVGFILIIAGFILQLIGALIQ